MIAVIVIMTILVTLCLSMLLASSVLISNAQKLQLVEQCRVSAVTLSKELDKDLCGNGAAAQRPMAAYLRGEIDPAGTAWPYYNPKIPGHEIDAPKVKRQFAAPDPAARGTTGEMSITLYWGSEDGKGVSSLTMQVTATRGDSQYTVTAVYSYLTQNADTMTWALSERR